MSDVSFFIINNFRIIKLINLSREIVQYDGESFIINIIDIKRIDINKCIALINQLEQRKTI